MTPADPNRPSNPPAFVIPPLRVDEAPKFSPEQFFKELGAVTVRSEEDVEMSPSEKTKYWKSETVARRLADDLTAAMDGWKEGEKACLLPPDPVHEKKG